MKRRILASMLSILLILALAFTGCSKTDNTTKGQTNDTADVVNETPDPKLEEKHDPVTLKMIVADPSAYQELFDLFNKKYPWITIEPVVQTTSTMETVVALEAAGTPADIVWIMDMSQYVQDNMLIDLKPYMDNDEELKSKKIKEGFLDAFDINGKRYGSPFVYVPSWILVNKDLLAKHGMEMPANDWTYDQLRDMAKKATDPAAGEYGLAFSSIIAMWFLNAVATANGSAPSLDYMSADFTQSVLNTPAVLEDFKWLQDFVKKDGSMASTAKAAELGLIDGQNFVAGKALFDLGGDWVIPILKEGAQFDWDVLPLPKGKATQATYGQVGLFGILTSSKHKDEAYKWVSFQFETEAQKWKIDQGATASVNSDELLNYYNESPVWQGKNISAVTYTQQLACCVSRQQLIPAYGEYPWGPIIQSIYGDLNINDLAPHIEAWNKKSLELRKQLGW